MEFWTEQKDTWDQESSIFKKETTLAKLIIDSSTIIDQYKRNDLKKLENAYNYINEDTTDVYVYRNE